MKFVKIFIPEKASLTSDTIKFSTQSSYSEHIELELGYEILKDLRINLHKRIKLRLEFTKMEKEELAKNSFDLVVPIDTRMWTQNVTGIVKETREYTDGHKQIRWLVSIEGFEAYPHRSIRAKLYFTEEPEFKKGDWFTVEIRVKGRRKRK